LFKPSLTSELNADIEFIPPLKKVYDKYQLFIADIIAEGIREELMSQELNPALIL